MSFAKLLPQSLIKNLRNLSITTPTPSQMALIPPIRAKSNVLIKDSTGSGKTMGVLLALASSPSQSLIITPTHSLASQISKWRDLLESPQITISHYSTVPPLSEFKSIFIDEVDNIINYPKRHATLLSRIKAKENKILEGIPKTSQLIAASATLDTNCKRMLQLHFPDAIFCSMNTPLATQHYCLVSLDGGSWRGLERVPAIKYEKSSLLSTHIISRISQIAKANKESKIIIVVENQSTEFKELLSFHNVRIPIYSLGSLRGLALGVDIVIIVGGCKDAKELVHVAGRGRKCVVLIDSADEHRMGFIYNSLGIVPGHDFE